MTQTTNREIMPLLRLPRDEPCFVFALYGVRLESNLIPLLTAARTCFEALGHPPSHLRLNAPDFGKKPLGFARAWKRLQRVDPTSVTSLTMQTMAEGWNDWIGNGRVMWGLLAKDAMIQMCVGLGHIPDATDKILSQMRDTLVFTQPTYGTGFTLPRSQGPTFRTMGILYGPIGEDGLTSEEGDAIGRWLYDGMHQAKSDPTILRDLYPYNLVTDAQLGVDIDGAPLRDWIAADPGRGQLLPWPEGYTLWTIDPASIPATRTALWPTRVLHASREPA